MKTILTRLQLLLVFFSLLSLPFVANAQTEKSQSKSSKEPPGDNFAELIQTGANLYRQHKYDEALAYYAKAARLSPQSYQPQVLMGLTYLAQLKMKSASDSFAVALRLNPQDKPLYLLKATADMQRNATEEALAACRKAIELDPNYAEAYLLIGETIGGDEKRRSEAISAYRSALKLDPRLLNGYEPLADLLEQNTDLKGAEEVFRAGLAADPKKMNGRFAYGRLLVKQARLVEARELWKGRTSNDDNTHPNFIVLLERAEKLKRVTDTLTKNPNDPTTLVEMGLAVMDGENWVVDSRQEKAMVYFQQSLKINPTFAQAQYGICKAYVQLADTFGKYKKDADRELEKLKKLDSSLAKELEQYRKNYRGGIPGGVPVDFNK